MPEPEGGWGSLWPLDPQVRFLNHGSFGACPRHVLDHQAGLRDRLERQPVEFLGRQLPKLLNETRQSVARFLGCAAGDLVFVRNATAGVNAVLQSLPLNSGDELVVTDHAYAACRNVLDFAAQRSEARVVVCAQGVWFSVRPAGSAGADPPDLDQPRGLGPRRESSLSGRVRLDRNRSLTIPSMRLLRLSAQLYNRSEDYHVLAEALKELL